MDWCTNSRLLVPLWRFSYSHEPLLLYLHHVKACLKNGGTLTTILTPWHSSVPARAGWRCMEAFNSIQPLAMSSLGTGHRDISISQEFWTTWRDESSLLLCTERIGFHTSWQNRRGAFWFSLQETVHLTADVGVQAMFIHHYGCQSSRLFDMLIIVMCKIFENTNRVGRKRQLSDFSRLPFNP